jgi:hypothetical protein
LEDACILAHEFGHLLSDERGERSEAYAAAVAVFWAHGQQRGPCPTPEERNLVVAEEKRAWANGRETLARLGVDEWVEFDAMRDEKLAGYETCFAPQQDVSTTPETIDGLGLEPHDIPVVRDAFVAARAVAWGQVRPLCAAAVGSLNAADRLGLEACPQLILSSEKTTNQNAADVAMRAVAAARAGLSDPSALPPGDPVAATFIALTAVAKDAESHIGVQLGPDAARVAVYGTNNCSHVVDFPGPGPEQAD